MTTPGHIGRSMAANQVPDELISEILSPLLKHSDEVFSEPSEKALLQPGYSSSTYLMVCKSWLRVSTPLLYNVVILRTTAQAAALEKVLQAHPEIGVCIKKLRVEGGFGNAMHTILARSPNITDLFLSAFIYGTDSVKGLCSGLPLIDPQRVILFDVADLKKEKPKKNKQVTQLLDALCVAVTKWKNLRIFDFPYIACYYIYISDGYTANPRAEALASALQKSKSLEVFLMQVLNGIPDYIRRVAKAPALKTIRLTGWKLHLDHARDEIKKFDDPKLMALVEWDLLQSTRKEPNSSSPSPSPSPPPRLRQKPVEQLSDLKNLGQTPGAALREMSVNLNSFGPYDPTRRPGNPLRPPAVDPQILKPFVGLTDLHWATQGDHSKLCFSKPLKNFTALENLQKLKVRSYLRSPSLLDIGMKLPLNSLQDVDLGESDNVEAALAFLKVHGAKLARLRALIEVLVELKVFDSCKSLQLLVVYFPSPNVAPRRHHVPDDFISASTPHTNLTKISFEDHSDMESAMKPNFTQLQPESFPALKEIQFRCVKWPTSEHQVRKNKWLPLAALLRPKNITLIDRDGVGGTSPLTGRPSRIY